MTDEEFFDALKKEDDKLFSNQSIANATAYAMTTASNLPSSTLQVFKDTVKVFTDPIGTAKSLKDVADGFILKLGGAKKDGTLDIYGFDGKKIENIANDGREERARKINVANTLQEHFSNRYGSLSAFKNAFKTDPAGVLADVSIIFTGGSMLAPKAGAVSGVLKTTGNVTDPIMATVMLGQNVKNLTQTALSNVSGKLSNTSGMLSTSYQMGKLDNSPQNIQKKKDFSDARSGKTDPKVLVDNAVNALSEANKKMKETYKGNKSTLRLKEFGINPSDVAKRLMKIIEDNPDFSDQAMKSVERVMDMVAKWENNPAQHTLEGLDTLKRSISNSTPTGIAQTTSDIANPFKIMKGEIVDIISKQAPDYIPVMNAYQEANDLQRMLSKEFAYKPNNVDYNAMLTKLNQSMRNNVTTNTFGSRLDSLNTLDNINNTNLVEQVAGLNANPLMSTGLMGSAQSLGLAYKPVQGLATIAGGSPRLTSYLAQGAGKADRYIDPALQTIRNNPLAFQASRLAGVNDRVVNQPMTLTDLFNQRPNQTVKATRDASNYLRGLLMGD